MSTVDGRGPGRAGRNLGETEEDQCKPLASRDGRDPWVACPDSRLRARSEPAQCHLLTPPDTRQATGYSPQHMQAGSRAGQDDGVEVDADDGRWTVDGGAVVVGA